MKYIFLNWWKDTGYGIQTCGHANNRKRHSLWKRIYRTHVFFRTFADAFKVGRHLCETARQAESSETTAICRITHVKTMENKYHSKEVIEFVTVALEICKRLENAASTRRKDFIDAMLKLLPLLYLKSQITLHFNNYGDVYLERSVTESDYNTIRDSVAAVMGEYDDYLDVFLDEMKYSDTPIRRTVSEDMADIYQELRDFLNIYEQNFDESTAAALGELSDSFTERWGQTVVNVLRPLHEAIYNGFPGNEEEN